MIGRGDSSALDELYARYAQRLRYYLSKMLGGDVHKAEDFLHDIFLRLIERPHLFDGSRNFSTWIFSCAWNLCKNEYRRKQVRNEVQEQDMGELVLEELIEADNDAPYIEQIDSQLFRRLLNEELEEVSPEQRTIFLLRYTEDFSLQEIADVTDIPLGTVKSRLFYVIRHLAQRLRIFAPHYHEYPDKQHGKHHE